MKKILMIIILSIFLPMLLIIPVHAETQEVPVSFEVAATTDYQWGFPAQSLNFVFDNNVFANGTSLTNQEVSITQKNGVPILLPVGASLDISVSSANRYNLKYISGELSSSVPYHIRKSGESSDIGSTIYSLKAGNTDGGSQFLDFVITADEAKNAKLAGKHTDRLTFEIKQVRPGATFDDGTTLTWQELKLAENGTKYGYRADLITDNAILYDEEEFIGAFKTCRKLTSIEIPASVTSIGYRAFYGCRYLTSITIPNSVTSIGEYTFYGCRDLTSIEIPNNVQTIGNYAFDNCTSLTSVTIPSSVTSIGDYAFSYCTSLTSVTIPSSVTSIGEQAFGNCTNLTSVTIGNGVTSVGNWAFLSCTSLTNINIPNSVTNIGDFVFRDCTNLTSVTFEEGSQLTTIGMRNFVNCTSLTSITIPDSVTSIRNYAFDSCTSLADITYTGTQAQWNAITFGEDWNINTGDYTVHCTDGDIAKS